MRTTETYETFCRHCLRKFERRTLAEASRRPRIMSASAGKRRERNDEAASLAL